MTAEPTPWRALVLRAQAMGIAPNVFWRLSLREWRALARPQTHHLSHGGLDTLMQQYPDHGHG